MRVPATTKSCLGGDVAKVMTAVNTPLQTAIIRTFKCNTSGIQSPCSHEAGNAPVLHQDTSKCLGPQHAPDGPQDDDAIEEVLA
jgi:hypothetical protein